MFFPFIITVSAFLDEVDNLTKFLLEILLKFRILLEVDEILHRGTTFDAESEYLV